MATEEMFIFVESDKKAADGMKLFLVPKRWEYYPDDEAVKLGKVQVRYTALKDLTPKEIRAKAIKTLRDKQERVIAEAQKRKMRLQEKIDNLLLLSDQRKPSLKVVSDSDDCPF